MLYPFSRREWELFSNGVCVSVIFHCQGVVFRRNRRKQIDFKAVHYYTTYVCVRGHLQFRHPPFEYMKHRTLINSEVNLLPLQFFDESVYLGHVV